MSSDPLSTRFTVIEQIGGGNYGTLFRVIDGEAASLADRIIATKKLKDAISHPHVLREVSVQRHAQRCSRHVAQLLHVVPRDQVRAALVLEYVPVDLRVFLNAFYCDRVVSSAPTWCATEGCGSTNGVPPTHIPLSYVRSMLRGLLEALAALHARGVVHRDVKPENILVEPLGLDHPLRCVCPPLTVAEDGSAGGCWVHAQRGSSMGDEASAPSHECTTSCLESCRSFFDGAVQLHHELSGEQLASAVHLLHCEVCRRAATAAASEESAGSVAQHSRSHTSESVPTSKRTPVSSHDGEEEEFKSEPRPASATSPSSPPPLSPDVKLCDFGSARHIGTLRLRCAEEQREELTPGPTTPVYCAPEMMLLQRYGTAVDMWAVGTIFFEMLTGEFFLSVGTLRSFYGDLVVHDDYCVMHRLRMMFSHLGTPSLSEWRRIAHPHYYPEAMLPHLPQLKNASLFTCLPGVARRAEGNASPVEKNEEGDEGHAGTRVSNSNGAGDRTSAAQAENGGQAEEAVQLSWASPSGVKSVDEAHPDISAFLLHHVGLCGLDLLRSLLRYNPEERLTAAEALRHPFLNAREEDGVPERAADAETCVR